MGGRERVAARRAELLARTVEADFHTLLLARLLLRRRLADHRAVELGIGL